jgi:hypothetical protein
MRVKKRHAQNAHFTKTYQRDIKDISKRAMLVLIFVKFQSCLIFFESKTYIVYALSCYTQ